MENPPVRRKLLRGSLAAPLVLTVASPSALARTSFMDCIARVANVPQPSMSIAFVSSPDGWYRTEVSIYEGKLRGGAGVVQLFYETAGRYYPVDACNQTGYSALDFTGSAGPSYKYKRLGLVYVNTSGNIVGFGPCKPSDGYAVSTSCWTSFKNG